MYAKVNFLLRNVRSVLMRLRQCDNATFIVQLFRLTRFPEEQPCSTFSRLFFQRSPTTRKDYQCLKSSKPNLQPMERFPLPLLTKRPAESRRVVKP